jgi:hypothetical protein
MANVYNAVWGRGLGESIIAQLLNKPFAFNGTRKHIEKSPSLDHTLSQLNPFHTFEL